MKSKKAKHGQTILAYVVLILLSFLCLFFFYISDRKCDALPCGSAERIFGDPGNLFSGKSEERGK